MKHTYYVVNAADGTVFAVFGSKLKHEADAYAKKLSRPGVTFYNDRVDRTKAPKIGTKL